MSKVFNVYKVALLDEGFGMHDSYHYTIWVVAKTIPEAHEIADEREGADYDGERKKCPPSVVAVDLEHERVAMPAQETKVWV